MRFETSHTFRNLAGVEHIANIHGVSTKILVFFLGSFCTVADPRIWVRGPTARTVADLFLANPIVGNGNLTIMRRGRLSVASSSFSNQSVCGTMGLGSLWQSRCKVPASIKRPERMVLTLGPYCPPKNQQACEQNWVPIIFETTNAPTSGHTLMTIAKFIVVLEASSTLPPPCFSILPPVPCSSPQTSSRRMASIKSLRTPTPIRESYVSSCSSFPVNGDLQMLDSPQKGWLVYPSGSSK